MKTIHDEKIKKLSLFQQEGPEKKEFFKAAFGTALKKIDEHMDTFTYKFPASASINNIYPAVDNIDWTNSFWTGMLWLAYEITGDVKYRHVAEIQVMSFKDRIDYKKHCDHHDLGFLYSLSCVAAYKLTGNQAAKHSALKAAEYLTTRYKHRGKFIQAWGDIHDPKAYRLIIDCCMNLPLLYWAAEETGDRSFYEMAYNHVLTSVEYCLREDASAFHTFYFDPETGEPVKGVTAQGFSDDSSWARGQAWAIYGLPLSYIYTKDKNLLDVAKKLANYFLNRLPDDLVCYWDLVFTSGEEERDSSAAAIAACGLLELAKHLPESDESGKVYYNAANKILVSLANHYTTKDMPESNGLLLHAVYSKPGRHGVDECNIWGDYFYLEGLVRLMKDWKLYW